MKPKSYVFAVVAFFVCLLAMGFASAAVVVSVSNDLTKSQNLANITLTNTNTTPVMVKLSISNFEDEDDNVLELSYPTGSLNIPAGESTSAQVSYSGDPDDIFLGVYESKINVLDASTNSLLDSSKSIIFINSYCEEGEKRINNKGLRISGIKDLKKDNDKIWEWKPNQNIEIEVKVERVSSYQDDEDIDIVIEYGLYDFKTGDFIIEESQDFVIDSSDNSDKFNIEFKVPSSDIDKDKYQFYVKVTDDSEDEADICADKIGSDYFQNIEIKREKHDIQIDDLEITSPAACGTISTLSFVVSNVGKSDEDKVKITVASADLRLNQEIVLDDLESGDSKSLSFDVAVPEGIREGTYTLKITTEFDYSSGSYRRKQDSASTPSIKVEGNCERPRPAEILINKETAIQSGGSSGEPLVLRITIMNPGKLPAVYTLVATEYDAWVDSATLSSNILSLNGGESRDINITLNVKNGVNGEQSFIMMATSATGDKSEQPISLDIKKRFAFSFPSLTGGAILNNNNWYLWAIGLINIILVILIVIFAVRIAKSSADEANANNKPAEQPSVQKKQLGKRRSK